MWIDPCPWCDGRTDECYHCDGDGRIGLLRCPNTMVTQREYDCVSATVLAEQSILPDVGGWHDQASTFVQAFPLVASEVGKARHAAQERAAKKANQSRKR